MSVEEFQWLRTHEGRIQFLANHTGLDPVRVAYIDMRGQAWPLGLPEGLGDECVEEGIEPHESLAALNPLLDMELDNPDSEHENPEVAKHIQEVATLSGEDDETIRGFHDGMIAYLTRLTELVKEEAERKGRESDQK